MKSFIYLKERIFPPLTSIKENKNVEDENIDSNFLDWEPNLDILCNVVSILPAKYHVVSEIEDIEEDFDSEDMTNHKPICYYVINNGCVEEQHVMFERPNVMNNHCLLILSFHL